LHIYPLTRSCFWGALMNNSWKKIGPEHVQENVFELIGKEWMLVTAGEERNWNTMTASWGGLGVLWGKNVSTVYIRDSRYTFEFMNRAKVYTLSFFDQTHRDALSYCGSHSGRDVDKAKETGLHPVIIDGGVVFEEARMVLVCRTLYSQDFDPKLFLDQSVEKHYPNKDYHRMYIGEIESVYCTADA
jgi:flavin reductase (DIM6/NTAB) family NADH-FMN oxidoreductase RutF